MLCTHLEHFWHGSLTRTRTRTRTRDACPPRYYVYFAVVRNSMAIWNCKYGASGLLTMSSEPSVACDMRDAVYAEIFPWSIASIAAYGVGIPLVFMYVLGVYKREIKADQELRMSGLGDTRAENPQLSVRKRYQKLYNDFRCGHGCLFLRAAGVCVSVCVFVQGVHTHVCARVFVSAQCELVCVCVWGGGGGGGIFKKINWEQNPKTKAGCGRRPQKF
jgi:hypothetical protein